VQWWLSVHTAADQISWLYLELLPSQLRVMQWKLWKGCQTLFAKTVNLEGCGHLNEEYKLERKHQNTRWGNSTLLYGEWLWPSIVGSISLLTVKNYTMCFLHGQYNRRNQGKNRSTVWIYIHCVHKKKHPLSVSFITLSKINQFEWKFQTK